MDEMNVNAKIVIGKSKKTEKEFVRVDIYLTETYRKVIFLEPAEAELVKITYNE